MWLNQQQANEWESRGGQTQGKYFAKPLCSCLTELRRSDSNRWQYLSLMPCFHSSPHLLLGEYCGEGNSGTEPEPLISPTPIALLPKSSSCPERKEGVCSSPLGVDSNEYRLTREAFWMWRQPCYCLWVLVPSARGKPGRLLKSAAAGLCVWYIDTEFKPETSGEMYGYFAVSQDSANWFLALFVWFSLAGY